MGKGTERGDSDHRWMQSTELEGLLTPAQLSVYLNISVATIYDWR